MSRLKPLVCQYIYVVPLHLCRYFLSILFGACENIYVTFFCRVPLHLCRFLVAFQVYDKNNDGHITITEMRDLIYSVLRHQYLGVPEHDLRRIANDKTERV